MTLVAFRPTAAEPDALAAFRAETADGMAPLPEPPGRPTRRRWIGRIVGLVLLAGASAGGWWMAQRWIATPALATITIGTTPSGAEIIAGGISRGVSPVTFTVAPGPQTIVVVNGTQRLPIDLTVDPGASVSQHIVFASAAPSEPAPAPVRPPEPSSSVISEKPAEPRGVAVGYLSVSAPVSVQIVENGQVIGSSDVARLMLPAGAHDVELVNDDLGVREQRRFSIAAGRSASIRLDLPKTTLNINATPWADVTVDGQPAGETPIGNYAVAVGAHIVTFRHPDFGERQQRVTAGLKAPNRVTVDMKKD